MDEQDQKYDDLVSKYHEKCDLLLSEQWLVILRNLGNSTLPNLLNKTTLVEVTEIYNLCVQMEEMEAEDAERQGDSEE